MTYYSRDFVNKVFAIVGSVRISPDSEEDQRDKVIRVLIQEHPDIDERLIDAIVAAAFEAYERGWFK